MFDDICPVFWKALARSSLEDESKAEDELELNYIINQSWFDR